MRPTLPADPPLPFEGSSRRPSVAPLAFVVAVLALAGIPAPASAQSDDADDGGRPELMREPITFTDVVDAFDDEDIFDLNLTVGFMRSWEIGQIQRQYADPTTADARMTGDWHDIANYERGTNILNLGLDVGIFRDLAVYARLPLLLSDDRSLSRIGSPTTADGYLSTPSDGPVFAFDPNGSLHSPTRSGVDYMTFGLAWSLLNQHRDSSVPTWMIMLEGRFNLGDPMRACRRSADMTTTNCNNQDNRVPGGGPIAPGLSAGVGRGMNALRIETRASWRYEVIEPYAGLAFQMEWPGYSSDSFLPSGALAGYINTLPPIQGRFTLGAAIIPWEDRLRFQRFTIDLRLTGDYVSEGHEYSPIFDALGSSSNPYFTHPTLEGLTDITNDPGEICNGVDDDMDGDTDEGCGAAGLAESNFFGLTDVQSHGRFGGLVTLEMQAARYIRFAAAVGWVWSPPYVLTQADACNPNVSTGADSDVDLRRVGTCRGGIINPHHRPVIDMPGNRFRVAGTWQIDLSFTITAMF